MQWVSATWTRTIVTILVTWAVLFTIQVGKDQGWYPLDPTWRPCTTASSTHEPCVMDDGSLLIVIDGRAIIYPREGK